MKQLILAVALATAAVCSFAGETKRVCVDQFDAKTKTTKQVCRDVKVHKKLEGTPVPPKHPK